MNGVNLIPASRVEASARRARVRVWAGVLAVAAVLNVLGAASVRAILSMDITPLQAQIAQVKDQIAATDSNHLKVRAEISRLLQAELASTLVGEHPDWSLLLRAVNLARDDGVSLELFELRRSQPPATPAVPAAGTPAAPPTRTLERYTLTLRGIATDLARVMRFVNRLEELGVMDSVAMKQSRADASRGVTVTGFDIECALAERVATGTQAKATSATADASPTLEKP